MSDVAVFAAGCFWGVEEAFRSLPGVLKTRVGYTGGRKDHPTYHEVCEGDTGHAEALEIEFNPEEISYSDLLDVFWANHNPTTLNRQGPDVGVQYRSAIFFKNPQQESEARQSKDAHNKSPRYKGAIVTEITPAAFFWPAEEYHQKYLMKRGADSCHF